ncbi:unnamed protein product [Urochloa decumbens]|uniref:Uncharacterized protein n=1 Tax=Urochloa decumbens TaxID=240449 RepID=A0ABC9B3V5_9POAL
MAPFLLLLFAVIAGTELRACAALLEGYYPMASSCSTTGNYTDFSQYRQNLRQLLSVLPTEVTSSRGFHEDTAGAAPDEVFGLMMCYADRKLDECQYCLAASITLVTQQCPNSRRVSASYDACLLRYADTPFAPVADATVAFYVTHSKDATVDSVAMAGARARLMVGLTAAAAASPSRVANGSSPYNATEEVFGLVQCTRDLNASECSRCITSYIDQLPQLFPGDQTGGAVKGYSCLLRFETAAFDMALPPAPEQPQGTSPAHSKRGKRKTRLVAGVSAGSTNAFLVFVGLAICFVVGHRKRLERGTRTTTSKYEQEEEDFFDVEAVGDEFENGTGPKRFRYSELVVATNNFSDDRMLGQGGFGSVYRGYSKEMNLHMAVKRVSKDSKQGRKEYASEVRIISRLRHRNLVQLIGWCHGGGELLLAYELMPNGSLDGHLYSADRILTWPARYNIVVGIATALLYLHEEWEQCVLHRDIKPSNVMLDGSLNAKLGDFGLARLVEHGHGSHTTLLAGTMGYMDPECIVTSRASTESDIYSFGVVLLEIACGRRPVVALPDDAVMHLAQHVSELHDRGTILDAADPRLNGEFDFGEMKCVLLVGLWCTHHSRSQRLSIRQAVSALRFEAPLPSLPSGMPVATYMPPIGRLDYVPSSILSGRT